MFPPGDFARLKWTLERANSITTVSGDIARKVKVLLGTDRDSIRVIYNSVDSVVFQPGLPDAHLREKLGIRDNELVLGFSGELRQKKGLNQMLTAFCEVRRHRPACLLVIGEVRSRDQPALATFAAQSPEDFNRLIITGHLEVPSEIARHLRLCDVFLQPSLWEGLPNALLEAMACGLLVLGSDAGGIREVVESGKTGFLLPRTELHRLGEAVLELLSMSKVQRQSIGHAARHHVCLNFSSDQENLCLQEVIHDLFPQC
jgi:glycosyltransferase involved in cell wall biosynthesis